MLIRRTHQTLAASIALVVSHSALAIGVGEIVVNSYVNEPLSAEIAVLDPKDLSDSEVIASLASLEDFERLGIERHYSLGSLVFETNMTGGASSAIRVSTENPIREPYLNFLIELKWPEGRVLREYTVFLDLRPRPQVTSTKRSSDRGQASVPKPRLTPGAYRVAPNDTLGEIAARFRGDGVTNDQMMLAIKDANPGKFLRDNINGIRAGVLLEIPSRIDDSLSARDAARRVANQWDEWTQPVASRGLRIVADNEIQFLDDSVTEGDAGGESLPAIDSGSAANVAPASADPQIESETRALGNRGNDLAAIEARLVALSDQLTEIQNVVASKDEEIATLKAELARRPVASASAPAPAFEQSTTPAEEKSGTKLALWAFLIAALGAGAYIARRRFSGLREGDSDNSVASVEDRLDTPLDDLLPVPSQGGSIRQSSDSEVSKGYGESLLTGYAADQSLADAIAEADIYVAYGRHQHALDTLEAASAAEPGNASGLLKMLDIYVSLDRFEEAQRVLPTIEQTGDHDSLRIAMATLSGLSDVLQGDVAAKELAAETEVGQSEESAQLDVSLDLEFQEAANVQPEASEESDTSGMLDVDEDPTETALDLARAYLDMGDKAGAKDLLATAISMGDEAQIELAKQLLASIE